MHTTELSTFIEIRLIPTWTNEVRMPPRVAINPESIWMKSRVFSCVRLSLSIAMFVGMSVRPPPLPVVSLSVWRKQEDKTSKAELQCRKGKGNPGQEASGGSLHFCSHSCCLEKWKWTYQNSSRRYTFTHKNGSDETSRADQRQAQPISRRQSRRWCIWEALLQANQEDAKDPIRSSAAQMDEDAANHGRPAPATFRR